MYLNPFILRYYGHLYISEVLVKIKITYLNVGAVGLWGNLLTTLSLF